MRMYVLYHPQFQRDFDRLPKRVQDSAIRAEKLFRNNPRHPSLKTHKLHGKMRGLLSFSVTREYRIVFELSDDRVVFLIIGKHEIYR